MTLRNVPEITRGYYNRYRCYKKQNRLRYTNKYLFYSFYQKKNIGTYLVGSEVNIIDILYEGTIAYI